MNQSRSNTPDRPPAGPKILMKVLGIIAALLLIVLGALWAFQPGVENVNRTLDALGPVVAGFGVALAYVVIRGRR